MSSHTLGERLRSILADQEARSLEALRRRAAAEGELEVVALERVEAFFGAVRETVIAQIEAGRAPKPFALGQADTREVARVLGVSSWSQTAGIVEPRHKYHSVWLDFSEWLKSNGLEATWKYDWDNGGIHSWFNLTVKPAAQ
ncbi:hypothetical protein F6X40_23990 [Paraburkholderia sp. UCT31]|uniref:hypothetical protein n=1 Tax=Paraburkholderia sp. UCT31 TaxID=2615209 RepID=UPI0016555396|nr:hypothetical protein [Paraburkholderia sp. UCT31]MBC8739778.1 hypothetical protein [Paraburkholderia sp. UCT31]